MSETFRKKYGPWALVTGASSGIGLAFARSLAERGLNLILVARRVERLQTLAAELELGYKIETRALPLDLSQPDFLTKIQVTCKSLDVGLLINNAGFGTTGELVENDLARELKLLDVNCRAPLILAHFFGKQMKDKGRGGIIFTASIVSFTAVPLWSQYAASKAYDLLLSEALSSELKPYGVDVLALCPGTTEAEFQEVAGTRMLMPMTAEAVVAVAIKKLGRQSIAIPGILNQLNVISMKYQPRAWSRALFGRVIRMIRK